MELGLFSVILAAISMISFLHYLFFRDSELRFLHTINGWICIISFIVVLAVGILMVFFPITEDLSTKTEIVEEYRIVSVAMDFDDRTNENTLVTEDNGVYYYYYVVDGEKEVRLGSAPVDNTTIIYNNGGEPSFKLLRTIIDREDKLLFLRDKSHRLYSSYMLEIPKDSLVKIS